MTGSDRLSYAEVPVFFDADGTTLFGIVTRPRDGDPRTAMVMLPGGGTPLTVNRNRVTVRLCRAVADLGYASLRMDYHGTGESAGTVDAFHLARPFVADVIAGIEHLRGIGVERIVTVGLTCFGARTALATAAERDDVEAVVAMALPLRDFAMGEGYLFKPKMQRGLGRDVLQALRPRTIRGLFDRRRRQQYRGHARAKARLVRARLSHPGGSTGGSEAERVSPGLIRILERVVDRGIPILLVYGDDEEYFHEFEAARTTDLRELLERAGSLIRVETVPGRVHGLARVDVQDAVSEVLLSWAKTDRSGARSASITGTGA